MSTIEGIAGKAIAIAIFIIIVAAGAFAEDVYFYDMTRPSAGIPSLSQTTDILRWRMKKSMEVALRHGDPNIVRNDSSVQEVIGWLRTYHGVNDAFIEREFQTAVSEYTKEIAREVESQRNLERLYDEAFPRNTYNPHRTEARRAIPVNLRVRSYE